MLGISNQSIGGEVTDFGGELELTLRVTGIPIQTYHYDYSATSKKKGLNYLLHEAAKAIIAEIDPYRMAVYYQRKNQFGDGLRFVNKLLKERPEESAWAYVAWGNILDKQGKLEEAIEKFKRASELEPSLVLATNNQAWIEFRLENVDTAIELFYESLKHDKSNAATWNSLAFCLKWIKNYPEADQAYQKACELEPTSIFWPLNLAYSKFEQGDTLAAKELLNELMTTTEAKGAELHYALFNYYNLLDDKEQAIKELETVLSLDDQHFYAINNAVTLYFQNGHYVKAIESARKIIQLAPQEISVNLTYTTMDAYNTIAMSQYKLERFDSAYYYVEKSIQQDNSAGMPYSTLAEIHDLTGKKEAFYEAAEIAMQKGFPLWNVLEDEPYQTYMATDPRFRSLIKKYQPKGNIPNAVY